MLGLNVIYESSQASQKLKQYMEYTNFFIILLLQVSSVTNDDFFLDSQL